MLRPRHDLAAGFVSAETPAPGVAFAIGDKQPRRVLIRATGPTLGALGLKGHLADPRIELLRGDAHLAGNDDWGGGDEIAAAVSRLGALPFASAESKDAALLVTLAGSDYRVVARGADADGGVVLLEIRELP